MVTLVMILSSYLSMTPSAAVFFDESGETPAALSQDAQLPQSVDNSRSKYFPKIENQGNQGACVCWAQGYYQFTYMMNRAMDVETTPENTFSPYWLYNFANGGRSSGTWEDDVYDIMKEIGCLRMSDAIFSEEDDQNWYPYEEIWKTAMKYRISDYTIFKDVGDSTTPITSPDDPDLQNIKTLLSQGEVLAVTTYAYDWKVVRIKQHQDAPENDIYLNEYVVDCQNGNSGRHRITLVGYNDNIWTDINDNGDIDPGEMGAFKIANSWGEDLHNKGFMWIAYDALNKSSCVSGGITDSKRLKVFNDVSRIEILPYNSDTDIYLRYTLNTSDRGQCKMYATATKDGEEYTFEIGPKRDHGMQSSTFSYDGTTNTNDGTMVYALSNVVPGLTSENLHEYMWSIKFEDTKSDGKVFFVKSAEIVDESTGRVCNAEYSFPFKLDGNSKTVNYPHIEEYNPKVTVRYRGFDSPYINYRCGDEQWIRVPMVPDSTFSGFTHSFTVETETDAPMYVYFSDESGMVDDNNGNYYIASERENFYATDFLYGIIGDSNSNGSVSVTDATLIQKYVGALTQEINLKLSDCDADSNVNVKDATCIQKYIAFLSNYGDTGQEKLIEIIPVPSPDILKDPTTPPDVTESTISTQPVTETEPITQENTEPKPENVVYFTNSRNWSGNLYCYYWSDSNTSMTPWPGVMMTYYDKNTYGESVYRIEIPQSAEYVIFTNGSTQTVDVAYPGGEKKYYPADTTSDGKYKVLEW